MTRAARVLPLLLPALLVLAGCGTEKAASDPAAGASAADHGELDARARALGVAPELVHVTEAPGFTLAQQSVGVLGDDGFSATYVSRKTGAQLRLSVDRGSITADTCPAQPVGDMAGERTACVRDGDAWYRTGAGRHEYALPEDGYVVRVSGETDAVPRDVLHAAAGAVHRPDAAEAAALLPSVAPERTAPVERGDLPPVGDGAPDNDAGAGG
ncbi:hypothetical protein ACWD00_35400 [Streptomyces viridiviolaceus]